MSEPGRYIHDDLLGYVPRPGHSQPGLTIDCDGLRSTGDAVAAPALPPVLAVGDSFTFGEDVADDETWPAQLQRLLGRRVLNGGMSGYGFDQIVLRGERLAAAHQASVMIVGFISDDVGRTEFRRLWWRDKPWFARDNGHLSLKGVPVPAPRHRPPMWGFRRLHEGVLSRLDPNLQHRFGYHVRIHPRGTGEDIACGLTNRLAALQRSMGIRMIVVAFYDGSAWQDDAYAAVQRRTTLRVLDCARRNGLATIDSFPVLAAEPNPRALYDPWHMNSKGYLVVARLIATALARHSVGPSPATSDPSPGPLGGGPAHSARGRS